MTETFDKHHDAFNKFNDSSFLIDLRRQMLKFSIVQLANIQQAEDAVQEALLSAYQHQSSFTGQAAFKTWVFAILKNKIIDIIRQKSRLVLMSELFDDQEDLTIDRLFDKYGHWQKHEAPQKWPSPDELIEQNDFWRVFDACLNHLPAKYAQVFMLREMIELSTDEICQKLQLTISNVNVLMYRSRARLRECLENKGILQEDCSC